MTARWSVCVVLLGALGAGCQEARAPAVHEIDPGTSVDVAADEAGLELLDAFARAWNAHDVDALMSMMTEDCVYEASTGDEIGGHRFEGQEAVRASFEAIFEAFPDAQWNDARHFVSGDRGLSEWTFTGTMTDGRRVEVYGCDVFTLRAGKIWRKNSFRKNRPPIDP